MDFMKMMKQAKDFQDKMGAMQEQIASIEVEGSSGGGMVSVRMTAKGEMRALSIDPTLLSPDDAEMVEDLIIAATNAAKSRADAVIEEKTREMMGGLRLPAGMKFPF